MSRNKGKAGEEWRPVVIDDGMWAAVYEVSTQGRVRSSPTAPRHGRREPGSVLFTSLDNKGYPQVVLYRNGKRKTVKVHRLVATAFLVKPFNGAQVNHRDGSKTNNAADNLEYVTNKENQEHAVKTLRDSWVVRGERMSAPEAVRRFAVPGVHEGMARRRVNRLGWDVDRALSTPPLPSGRPKSGGVAWAR